MELSLYAPVLGYYSAGRPKFNAAGDFVTAPELSPVFAQCLARQCRQILNELERRTILEVGAGTGSLCADLLLELERLDSLPEEYAILEVSETLRHRQAQTLQQKAAHLAWRVRWTDRLPDPGFCGAVIGNELLDALPVERFRIHDNEVRQLQVSWQDDCFSWRDRPAPAPVCERVGPLNLPSGYTSEINFSAEAWVRSVGDVLAQGVVLLIDYGFPRREFYHPQRNQGTLMCHYRHRAHDDPLVLVGLQDLTAHIDFTAVAEAAADAGLRVLGYTSQAAFLLATGIEEIVARADGERAHFALTQQIKKLTLPHEMGELYKVIALGRGFDAPLLGFMLQDRRGRL